MKTEDLEKMNPEQKRIRIGELCGWRRKKSPNPDFKWIWIRGAEYCWGLPDYRNNLNAMHEVEMRIAGGDRRSTYLTALAEVVGCEPDFNEWPYVTATAMQRADAFLLTMG